MPSKNSDKDIVLFVNSTPADGPEAAKSYGKKIGRKLTPAVIRDSKKKKRDSINGIELIISCDLNKPLNIAKALKPYEQRLLAVTCRGDKNVADFAKIVPHLPYLKTPSTESLEWSVDKIQMRKHFQAYDKKITPPFVVVGDATKESIDRIDHRLTYPVIIKPAGLGASLLVTICYHREELEESLKKVFRKLKATYKKNDRQEEPRVLVEEYMEGEMYSIDGYVNSRGTAYLLAPVHIKTGKAIGFDDFFGYQQLTPTLLKKANVEKAHNTAIQSVRALGLRSTTVHVELMKTEEGFKVIELGPRIGGFRTQLYKLSYGIDHALNDILIRIPKKPEVNKKVRGYSVAMKFFAKKEGRLEKLLGIKKIKELDSYHYLKQNKKVGDMCKYAKNGGKSVFNLIMFNKSRSALLADIRRVEKSVKIIT